MKQKHTRRNCILALGAAVIVMAFVCLFVGSSDMQIGAAFGALFGSGDAADIRIMQSIRLPRVLAALIAGAGLSVSGLMMQTTLHNPMASASTLGVSNAAVFGANLSILLLSGGWFVVGKGLATYWNGVNPFATSAVALVFSMLSVLGVLGLCRLRSFSPGVVVLAGIAIGAVWTAATTILQFYATDVGLSAAVAWSFGDLGRATMETDLIMLVAVAVSLCFFCLMRWQYNALLSGTQTAVALGVPVGALRFLTLFLASLITAVCVSFLGIISFVGIICPHISKKLLGRDHRVSIPASALTGSLLLLGADVLARCIGNGSALPVGAITALLGAPFFVAVILNRRRDDRA